MPLENHSIARSELFVEQKLTSYSTPKMKLTALASIVLHIDQILFAAYLFCCKVALKQSLEQISIIFFNYS